MLGAIIFSSLWLERKLLEINSQTSECKNLNTPAAALRPEAELLLCCARNRMDSETAARIRVLVQHDIDWEYLFRTASEHGIAPLLYRHLNAVSPESVPKETLDRLRDHFHDNSRRNLFLTGELLGLLHLFETHTNPGDCFQRTGPGRIGLWEPGTPAVLGPGHPDSQAARRKSEGTTSLTRIPAAV